MALALQNCFGLNPRDFDVSKIKAVSIDLDGTTINSKARQWSDYTALVFKALSERGIIVVPSTGRNLDQLGFIDAREQQLGFTMPRVCTNGSVTRNRQGVCQFTGLPRQLVSQLFTGWIPEAISVALMGPEFTQAFSSQNAGPGKQVGTTVLVPKSAADVALEAEVFGFNCPSQATNEQTSAPNVPVTTSYALDPQLQVDPEPAVAKLATQEQLEQEGHFGRLANAHSALVAALQRLVAAEQLPAQALTYPATWPASTTKWAHLPASGFSRLWRVEDLDQLGLDLAKVGICYFTDYRYKETQPSYLAKAFFQVLKDYCAQHFPEQVELKYTEANEFCVIPKGISKAATLKRFLAAEYGIDTAQELVSFGDNFNDLENLHGAKYGFHTTPSNPFVLEVFAQDQSLTHIGPGDESAVARWLNDLFDLGIAYQGETFTDLSQVNQPANQK